MRSDVIAPELVAAPVTSGMKNVLILDPAQQAAADAPASIQLVLAGPGSGKTTTLTSRFVRLVQQGADRKRILALTFTRKAADEIKHRIADALALESARELMVATFHGFSFRQLRSNPQAAGLSERFQLWDTPQQRRVFHARHMWWNEETDILDIIGGAKERLLDAASFAAQIDEDDQIAASAVDYFRVYEKALRDARAIDFADMVPLVVKAMDDNFAYAAAITGRYDHVLVDEYQDVNPGQIQMLDHFVKAGVNLWAVGDDDQTLYAFRAADVRFILDFSQKHPRAQIHVLDRNYRSGAQIVAAAKRLIANNLARCHKDYRAVVPEAGEIVIRGYRAPEIEARQAARAVASPAPARSPSTPDCRPLSHRLGWPGAPAGPAKARYPLRGARCRRSVARHRRQAGGRVAALSARRRNRRGDEPHGQRQARGHRTEQARPGRQ